MKKILIAATVLAFSATTVFATAVPIVKTKHNLSKTGSGSSALRNVKAATSDQICAFCHTPHQPKRPVPLWNRSSVNKSLFSFYTSSQQLSAAARGAEIVPDSVSAMCMSCHAENPNQDMTAGNTVIKDNTRLTDAYQDLKAFTGTMGKSTGLSTNLSNSHPFGFSYVNAQTGRQIGSGDAKSKTGTPLNTDTYIKGQGLTLYNTSKGNDQIECASCHKTHDNQFRPFLRISNANSQLCRTCHTN